MRQLVHLDKNLAKLQLRFCILKLTREFFWQRGFTEIEAPLIVAVPGQEPNIQPIPVVVKNEKQRKFKAFLHTSPEYAMKKMLAVGFEKIFYLGKCFRDQESFGGTHNPEFTMLEWYRPKANYFKLMDDLESLTKFVNKKLNSPQVKLNQTWERISMKALWRKYIKVDLDEYLTRDSMLALCVKLGFQPNKKESYEELFYRIFLNKVEPFLGKNKPVFVYEYPSIMASLSKISADERYAERFELYFQGLELANVFTELNDAKEQKRRLSEERKTRKDAKNAVYPLDEDFLDALRAGIGDCAGGALGVDRFVMLFTLDKEIDNVLGLPMSKLLK